MFPFVPSYSSNGNLFLFSRLYRPTSHDMTPLAGNSWQRTQQWSTSVHTWRQRYSTTWRTTNLSLSLVEPPQFPREERHLDYISHFTTDIFHIRDTDNQPIDTLSRVIMSAATLADGAVDYHLLAESSARTLQWLNSEPLKGQTSLKLERVQIPHSRDDLLCDVSLGYPHPYIPPSLRQRFFDAYHEHHGIRPTQHLMRSKVAWPAINKDVQQFCRLCIECQRNKIRRNTKPPLQTFPIPYERFQQIRIDIVGTLPIDDGYSFILTMIDCFTRWPEATPIRDSR